MTQLLLSLLIAYIIYAVFIYDNGEWRVMAGGRPTDYTTDLACLICGRIACGEAMRSIARDETMPAMSTLFKWLNKYEEFAELYAIAKQQSADVWADDIIDIADNEVGNSLIVDGEVVLGGDGKPVKVVDGPAVNHARLRIDARKWSAAKLKPRKYGDRVMADVTHNPHEDWLKLMKDE